MRRTLSIAALIAVAALGLAAPGHAEDKKMSMGKPVIVTGTLIDTKCFSMDKRNKGTDHVTMHGDMKDCAKICAGLGIPVAVLTAQGKAWTLVTPAKDLVAYMGQNTRVTGTKVYDGSQIRPDKIEVKDASGKWTEVKITMPMPM